MDRLNAVAGSAPRCSLSGVWAAGGRSGVCHSVAHPRCRIPALVPAGPAIPTEKGWLRPERSLVYDDQRLLLHHAASTHPGAVLTLEQLSAFQKTASRVLALLRPYPWALPAPLDWPQPEQLLFSTCNDPLLYDLIQLRNGLQQIESLTLHTIQNRSFLAFDRCRP